MGRIPLQRPAGNVINSSWIFHGFFLSFTRVLQGSRRMLLAEGKKHMVPSLAGSTDLDAGSVERPRNADPRLEIFVVFTALELTAAALKKACALAGNLGARIVVLAARIVPYPLALTAPPVQPSFDESRLRRIVAGCPVETAVVLCLCRDLWQSLTLALTPNALVVLGVRKRWWPTREARLARKLRRAGYEVITAETALQTLHGGKEEIPLFGLTPGEEKERNGKVDCPLFHHVMRL